jgi:hypothetical protein
LVFGGVGAIQFIFAWAVFTIGKRLCGAPHDD